MFSSVRVACGTRRARVEALVRHEYCPRSKRSRWASKTLRRPVRESAASFNSHSGKNPNAPDDLVVLDRNRVRSLRLRGSFSSSRSNEGAGSAGCEAE
jgi:hypothetical protein